MSKMTVTEGLAEITTIGKKIEKKQQFVATHLLRQEALKDPLVGEGGSEMAIETARQSIADLEERLVKIRRAIQHTNTLTSVTVKDQTRSVADWLVWRREVAPGKQEFLARMLQHIRKIRDEARREGVAVVKAVAVAGSEGIRASDIIVHVDEMKLAEEQELLEEVLSTLDGQLTLKNAHAMIDIED